MKVMIGREEKIYNAFIDREQSITFNLLKEISVVNSRDYPGRGYCCGCNCVRVAEPGGSRCGEMDGVCARDVASFRSS